MFTFCFWIPIEHNLTFYFGHCKFANKKSFYKKLSNSNKLLYYVTINRILWRWLQEYHFHWHGTCIILLLIPLALCCIYLYLEFVSGSLVKWYMLNSTISMTIHECKIQGWNWFHSLWQLHGRRCKCCFWVICLISNIQKEVVGVFDFFFLFKEIWIKIP